MTMYEPRYGSSYVKKRGQASPENLLRRIRRENPNSDWDTEEDLFHDAVTQDPDMMRACTAWVHTGAARNLERIDEAPTPQQAEKQYDERKKERATKSAKARKIVQRSLEIIVQTMTFGEVAKMADASPGLKRLAKMGKPGEMVGQKLTAAQIKDALR